jgi:hypothetical protein
MHSFKHNKDLKQSAGSNVTSACLTYVCRHKQEYFPNTHIDLIIIFTRTLLTILNIYAADPGGRAVQGVVP